MQVPLDGTGGATQEYGNVLDFMPLVIAHDKNGPLLPGQGLNGLNNALLLLGALLIILGVGVVIAFFKGDVFQVITLPAAAVAEAGIGSNAIKPCLKIALELEGGEILPGLNENFLVNVFSIFLVLQ